jgi:5-methylcytosine-specific restriction enzyme A
MQGSIGVKCSEVGCYAMVVEPERYCSTHKKQAAPIKTDKPRLALYNTDAWRKTRVAFLARNPLCNRCGEGALIVHHIKTARDYPELQHDFDNLEALCFACHQRETGEEIQTRRHSLGLPAGQRFTCKTTAIVGPPGAGKRALVVNSMGACDVVIDLDAIGATLTNGQPYDTNHALLPYLLDVRRYAVERLMRKPLEVACAWLIYGAPLLQQRQELRDAGADVVLLMPTLEQCYDSILFKETDVRTEKRLSLVDAWFHAYEPDE